MNSGKNKKYVMAIDAGTTSNRCVLFDHAGTPCAVSQKEFSQIYPKPGWVEHNAKEIWETVLFVCRDALKKAGADASDIAAIGIANQRETTVVWDRETGEPVSNAIVWQCRRTAEACDRLKEQGLVETIQKKTGLVIDAYFSGTKLQWILENVPGAKDRALRGELLFGTIETWIIWNLSGGKLHVTDYSNAARTMLFNIRTLSWDDEILSLLGIPSRMLPTPVPSSGPFGETDPSLFGVAVPITGAAGDQQAALFGQGAFLPGEAKNTYGTGAFLLMNTGESPVFSENGLVTTVAWGLGGKVIYALEGSVFVAGAVIQWLRDELGLLEKASDSEVVASRVSDTNGCYLVPAFTGLGAPYWDPYARGTLSGLTRGVNRSHIVRAALESIAFQVNDILTAMQKDAGLALSVLNVDGGASANNLLMQMQADLSGAVVRRPSCVETTALGAAALAGLAVSYWQSPAEVIEYRVIDREFTPALGTAEREEKIRGWKKAVGLSGGWAKD